MTATHPATHPAASRQTVPESGFADRHIGLDPEALATMLGIIGVQSLERGFRRAHSGIVSVRARACSRAISSSTPRTVRTESPSSSSSNKNRAS